MRRGLRLAGIALAWSTLPSLLVAPALADQICAVDLNGNGDAADPGETARCTAMQGGSFQCSLEQEACSRDASNHYSCPLGAQYGCAVPLGGNGTPTCSPIACIDTAANPVVSEPVVDDPGVANDGAVDDAGNCKSTIQIFSGRALRCRPPGLEDTFQNCCADKGRIVKDGMGSSLSSISTKIAVAKNLCRSVTPAGLSCP